MEIAAAGDDHKGLRRVARALLAEACKRNVAAASMIADRLDGKVPQPIGGSDELGPSGCAAAGAFTNTTTKGLGRSTQCRCQAQRWICALSRRFVLRRREGRLSSPWATRRSRT